MWLAKKEANNALKALSLDYDDYQTAMNKPPSSAADLNAFLKTRKEPYLQPGELDKLKVQWGTRIDSKNPDGANRLLAYHPPIGGEVEVLMQDATVKTMSQAEFAALSKK